MDQACRQDPPDLLIIDQNLPGTTGMDLILQIRNDRRMGRLPVILVADEALPRPLLDMLRAFQIPLVPKPLREQVLVGAINILFYDRTLITDRQPGTPRQLSATTATTAPPPITRTII